VFDGASFVVFESGSWEALSWLPGTEIGFAPRPPLRDVGAFLAAFHDVAFQTSAQTAGRPGGVPLVRLDGCFDWVGARRTMGSADGVDRLRRLLDKFMADLESVDYARLETCVVHGDPTTFNVVADGSPARPVGLIDSSSPMSRHRLPTSASVFGARDAQRRRRWNSTPHE
jgi:Ser/Thr protein kinase RdoA (MazF antagonist)